jgi:hypothetical protein
VRATFRRFFEQLDSWKSIQIHDFHELTSGLPNTLTAVKASLETWRALPLIQQFVSGRISPFVLPADGPLAAYRSARSYILQLCLHRESLMFFELRLQLIPSTGPHGAPPSGLYPELAWPMVRPSTRALSSFSSFCSADTPLFLSPDGLG